MIKKTIATAAWLLCIIAAMAQNTQHALVWVTDSFDVNRLAHYGIKANSRVGNIISVQGSNLQQLKNVNGIRYIENAYRGAPTRRQDSISLAQTRAIELHNNPTTYGFPLPVTGKGVIVGIVDIGFQLDHPNFLSRTGQSRIVRFWDQANDTGTPPQGFNYGSLYSDNIATLNYQDTINNHATHVTGIAAGSGYGTPGYSQSGMAPDADIVMVHIKYYNDTLPPGAYGDYIIANPTIIDAYDYIFKYADSVGKPAVINLSWGMHTGPHDGTSLFDQAADGLVGQGKVLVGSAGNDYGRNMHLGHQFSGDTVSCWIGEAIPRDDHAPESVYADFWGSASTEFQLQITSFDTLGNQKAAFPFISSSIDKDTSMALYFGNDTVTCTFSCVAASPLNGKPNILLRAENYKPSNSYLVLRVTSASTALNAWNSGGVYRYSSGGFDDDYRGLKPFNNMISGDNISISGENGGTGKSVITVGAYAPAFFWKDINGSSQPTFSVPGKIAGFSSTGPTVDGRIKPDLAAPGVRISSSINRFAYHPPAGTPDLTYSIVINGITHYYGAFSGTSMAGPQVTGIVALMLEQNPALTWSQVRDILRSTAATDSLTGSVPNNTYGWGKVDALAALQGVKGTTAIQALQGSESYFIAYPNPAASSLSLLAKNMQAAQTGYTLCNLQGQTVASGSFTANQAEYTTIVDIQSLASGLYLLRLENNGNTYTIRFVKE